MTPTTRGPYACRVCFDLGMVISGRKESSCPFCASWDAATRDSRRREDFARNVVRPGITVLDLDNEEFAELKRLQVDHPLASRDTVLSWLEGRRYDPSKDPEVIAEAERLVDAMKKRRKEYELERGML